MRRWSFVVRDSKQKSRLTFLASLDVKISQKPMHTENGENGDRHEIWQQEKS
jgi:hypothetical protein